MKQPENDAAPTDLARENAALKKQVVEVNLVLGDLIQEKGLKKKPVAKPTSFDIYIPTRFNFEDAMRLFPLDTPRDNQITAIRQILASYEQGADYVVLDAPTGCHEKGTPIMLASGLIVPVEEVKRGDYVMGVGGKQMVTELKRGRDTMVRIIPVKGDPFVVNMDHILTLVHTETSEVVDVSVRQWFEWSAYKIHCHKLFRVGVECFDGAELPLDADDISPYVLGLLLGDGALTKGVQIYKVDEELGPDLQKEATRFGLNYRYHEVYGYALSLTRGAAGRNAMLECLRDLKLTVVSGERFIPGHYKYSSLTDRREILAGLLDTDGHLTNNCFDYISQSKQLAEDVTFVARSVGLAAYMNPCEKYDQNGHGGAYYRVSISGDTHLIPTRIARKQAKPRQQKKDVLRTGFTVEILPPDDFYGFSLDGDGRFLMGDFTVTHNTGKSAIGVTIARYFGRAWYVTLTEQLQQQYLRDFEKLGMVALKGRGKFRCRQSPATYSCKEGKHYFTGKHACQNSVGCCYIEAREQALHSDHTIANYHSFLWNVGAAAMFGGDPLTIQGGRRKGDGSSPVRPLLVMDEAHAAESFLLDQVGVTVELEKISLDCKPPPEEEMKAAPYFAYIKDELMPKLAERAEQVVDPEERDNLGRLWRKLAFLHSQKDTEEWIPERAFLEKDKSKLNPNWFALKPLTVRSYGRWIWGWGAKQLLMSATVLSAGQLVHSLGLDPDKGDHIEMDNPFPVENRPVQVFPMNMAMVARDETWPAMAKIVDNLLSHHGNEKGLLLCPSNKMLAFLKSNVSRLNSSRFIFAFGDDRVQKYNEHISRKAPTVLAASGYWEGADLKGDSSRFAIIPSVPRAMWQGQIRARAGIDPTWYRWLSYTKLIQGMGRSIRSVTDEAITYILDKEFLEELGRRDSMVPKWMRPAVKVILPEEE